MCSRRQSRSCSTSGIRRVNLLTDFTTLLVSFSHKDKLMTVMILPYRFFIRIINIIFDDLVFLAFIFITGLDFQMWNLAMDNRKVLIL